jgi:membrane associated rhomboid family serine protease
MRAFSPSKFNAVLFLIALNILTFIACLLRPEIRYFLGLIPALFPQQPWTIVTNMFVHVGFGHILFNMISLYFLGSFSLRLVGERNFLIVYFLGGIVGNVLFILLANPLSMGVGASGAIFALGGALAAIAPRIRVFVFPIPAAIPLWVAIALFLLISFLPGIAWQAHVGGLILGLGAGYFLKKGKTYYF